MAPFAAPRVVPLRPRRYAAQRQILRSLWWLSLSQRRHLDGSVQREFEWLRDSLDERMGAVEEVVSQLEADFLEGEYEEVEESADQGYGEQPMKALPPATLT